MTNLKAVSSLTKRTWIEVADWIPPFWIITYAIGSTSMRSPFALTAGICSSGSMGRPKMVA
jgi:hypothetical protein